MKHFVFTLCFILFCGGLFSQDCPNPSSITFTSQTQVDNFASDYPGCTEITNLFIGRSNIVSGNVTNLNGLNQITSVNQIIVRNNSNLQNLDGLNIAESNIIEIENNDNLQNLNGLQNITGQIARLYIDNNDALDNLSGLESITSISSGTLTIEDNDALMSLKGLDNISSVSSSVEIVRNPLLTSLEYLGGLNNVDYNIDIISNASLTDISALSNITELTELIIRNNDNLINLSGLENLTAATGLGLKIEGNDALSDVSALGNLTNVGRGISISDNPVLTNLTGLEGVSDISMSIFSLISIVGNAALSDISGLNILPFFGNIENLNIYENPNLSVCSNEGICYYLASGRLNDIRDNSVGCNSEDEILTMCDVDNLCPVGDITFASQSDIDAFVMNYPNCATINGNLTITSPSLTNLNTLSFLQTIDGDLNICNNSLLTSIDGLSGVSVGGDFWLKNNDALSYTQASFMFNGGVYIEDNDILSDITSMTWDMHNMTYVRIINNPNLDICTVIPLSQFSGNSSISINMDLCSYLTQGNPSEIFNNGLYCNSAEVIVNVCNYFPITLTDFQAKIDNKTTLLTWQTATESNNAGFEIQRSTDATNWEKIAWQDGQGTTTNAHTYTHRDENPLFGTSYYRLKQVDFDGAFEYTHIVQVNYEGRDINIFPNPVKNTLHISDLNGETIQHISIYDQTGRAIHTRRMSENIIDVSALSPGMYILKMAVKGEVFCRKFIVQERK